MLRKDLLKGLEACMLAIGGDSNYFVFMDRKLYSHNFNLTVCYDLPDEIADINITGEVKASELYNTLNKFSKDEVSVAQADNTLTLKCGRAKANITIRECDYGSAFRFAVKDDAWIDVPADFVSAFSCRIPKNTSKCSGVYVSGNYLYSTNSLHLARYQFKDTEFPAFWLSEKNVDILTKLKDIRQLQVTDKAVVVKTDNATYAFSLLTTSNYPIAPISKLLSEDYSDSDVRGVIPSAVYDAVDRATQFGVRLEADTVAKLTFSEENITVYSECSNGNYSESIDWTEKPVMDKPLTVYVGGAVFSYLSKRATKFYLSKNNREIPRLFLENDNTVYLISTFDIKNKIGR